MRLLKINVLEDMQDILHLVNVIGDCTLDPMAMRNIKKIKVILKKYIDK